MDSILISGNLGGVAYTYAKYLRMRGVDVTLYLWNWELKKDTRNPMKTDVDCKSMPDWIRRFTDTKMVFREFRRISRDFDIFHAFNTDPLYAQFTGKPFISHPVGSDAREYAFSRGLRPALLRRAYRKNGSFMFGSLDYYGNVLKRTEVRNPVYIDAIQSIDIDQQSSIVPERKDVDELFFHPSSHIEKVKGNLNLIRAYARYVKEKPGKSLLVMIEWGEDIEKSKKLVSDLGISKHVVFKKWLGKQDIFNYMKCADIVFDQFILPSSSTVQREACALGKPVVKFMNKNWFRAYDEMPFVSAGTADELYRVFTEYRLDPDKFIALGKSAKEFTAKYYDWKFITGKIMAEYERMACEGRKE